MTRCSSALSVLALALTPVALDAADKYTLKIDKPAVAGERSKHTVSDKSDMTMVLRDENGKAIQDQKESKDETGTYVDTIVSKTEGKRADKLTRKYDAIKVVKDGKTLDLDLVGKVVVIERKENKYEFQYKDGPAVTGDTLAFLKDEFKSKDEDDKKLEKALMPKGPVAVGDTWTGDVKEFATAIDKEMAEAVDLKKATASGKLIKVYPKDGVNFGVIEITARLPITRIGKGESAIVADAGSELTAKLTLDVCIDGSRTEGTMKATMTGTVAGKIKAFNGQEFTMKLTIDGKMSETQTPVK